MKLTTVTITGADDSINPNDILDLSKDFPFVEWGILLSRNSIGTRRFPSRDWMQHLRHRDSNAKFSGHLCGAYVKEILMGNINFISELKIIWLLFNRIQINTHGIKHDYDRLKLIDCLTRYPQKEFIFQYDDINKEILSNVALDSEISCSALFDLSHGAGVLPDKWPDPIKNIKCGYAGGLSPENVGDQIRLISDKVDDLEVWIDMETHIRSDNDKLFDLKKVEEVLMICEDYIYNG